MIVPRVVVLCDFGARCCGRGRHEYSMFSTCPWQINTSRDRADVSYGPLTSTEPHTPMMHFGGGRYTASALGWGGIDEVRPAMRAAIHSGPSEYDDASIQSTCKSPGTKLA